MPEYCNDCNSRLYPGDWQAIAIYDHERLRLCETCKGKRDSGPLVAAKEEMMKKLRKRGFIPKG